MSPGEESTAVGRTGIMLYVKTPPAVVVTGSPGSVTETVTGPAPARLFENKRTRAPIDGGLVTVPVGMGKSTLSWPAAELSTVWLLPASVNVMMDAEEMFGAFK